MSPALDLLDRIRCAAARGDQLSASDTRAISAAVDRAMAGIPLEEALGLAGGWRQALRKAVRVSAGGARRRQGPAAQLARVHYAELQAYFTTRFAEDLRSGRKPSGEMGILYDLLIAEGCQLPSLRTLRRRMSE